MVWEELLTHATDWMDFKEITCGEKSQTQEVMCHMIPLCNTVKRQNHSAREQNSVCHG